MDFYDILLAKKLSGGGGGGSAVLINKNISSNGTYNASSDNADGYKKVVVSVPNPSTGSLSITSNNTYDVTNYASAVVNVPQGITPTGTLNITSNDTYDVTNYASAVVNVSGASLGGLSEMVDTTDQGKGWAFMLSAMKNGATVGGKITLSSNFTTTESLLLSTGLTTLNGFMFVGTDYKYGESLGSGNSNMWVIISRYSSNTKFGGTGFSQNLAWAGQSGMTEGTQYISGAAAFVNGALRFDGGDIYYTARYNNNNNYQFIRSGTQYEWLAW